jgi:hypothetical protein
LWRKKKDTQVSYSNNVQNLRNNEAEQKPIYKHILGFVVGRGIATALIIAGHFGLTNIIPAFNN